jgi:hypothetical protein
MRLRSVTIDGREWHYKVPDTAGDVLEFRVWAMAHREQPNEFLLIVSQWLKRWVLEDIRDLLTAETLPQLVALAEVVAASASLPPDVLDGLQRYWLRSSELDGIAPKDPCDCPKCKHGEESVPEGVCLFDGIPVASLALGSALMGLDDAGALLSQPYWLLQVQGVRSRLKSLIHRKMEVEREKKEETESAYDKLMPGWRKAVH